MAGGADGADGANGDDYQDRGRWGSEVARVYQRSLLRDQLDASGAMADADAADMEACIAGWVQPSNFR